MNSRLLISVLITAFLLVQCDRTFIPEEQDSIAGVWVFKTYNEDVKILIKKNNLDNDKYGIIFYEDGTLIERKNIGWCGTPPITYRKFEGNWEKINYNTYQIEVDYWGGMTEYKIEVVQVTNDLLKYKRIIEE